MLSKTAPQIRAGIPSLTDMKYSQVDSWMVLGMSYRKCRI